MLRNNRYATSTQSRPRLVGTTGMISGAADHVSSSLDGREDMTAGEWKQTHDHFIPVVDEIHFMTPYKPNRYLG